MSSFPILDRVHLNRVPRTTVDCEVLDVEGQPIPGLYAVVNVMAAPVAGAIFDAIGTRWLYALAVSGYGIGLLSLWITRPLSQKHI